MKTKKQFRMSGLRLFFCVIEKELFAYIMESCNIFFVHK